MTGVSYVSRLATAYFSSGKLGRGWSNPMSSLSLWLAENFLNCSFLALEMKKKNTVIGSCHVHTRESQCCNMQITSHCHWKTQNPLQIKWDINRCCLSHINIIKLIIYTFILDRQLKVPSVFLPRYSTTTSNTSWQERCHFILIFQTSNPKLFFKGASTTCQADISF